MEITSLTCSSTKSEMSWNGDWLEFKQPTKRTVEDFGKHLFKIFNINFHKFIINKSSLILINQLIVEIITRIL